MKAPKPALVLAIASLAILASAPAQYLGRQQDDLLYLIGAQSLLEGRFRLLTVPGEPPLYMIGPGFPALLAPLAFFAGEHWWIYEAFCAVLLAAAPWLIWLWLRKKVDGACALLIAVLFATSPLVLSQSGTVMSEGPFLLATLGLLLCLESQAVKGAAALLLFATQARTAAVCLLPGAAARPLSRKKWQEALVLCVPALIGMAAWSLWSRAAAGSAQQKLEELGVAYAGGLGRLPAVAYENAVYYLGSLGQSFLPVSFAGLAPLLGLALAVGAVKGAAGLSRQDRWEPAVWIVGGTALLHLAWPWQYERYLIMPLPFLLWFLVEGSGRAARQGLAALLCSQLLFQSGPWLGRKQTWTRPELSRTYAWLQERTAPADIVASVMYVRDGFLSSRPALPMPPSADGEELHRVLRSRKARFVLWQDSLDLGLSLDATSAVRGWLERDARALGDPKRFKLVHQDDAEHARIYELL